MVTAEGLSCSPAHLHGQAEWGDGVGASPACTSGGRWSGSRSRAAPGSRPPPPPAEVHTLLCEQNPPARQVKDNMVPVIQQLALPATPAGHHHHFCDGLGCR